MSSPKKAKKGEGKQQTGHLDSLPSFIKRIVERNIDEEPERKEQVIAVSGFPVAPLRDPSLAPISSCGKKKSIFAQQFEHSDMSLFGLKRLRERKKATAFSEVHANDSAKQQVQPEPSEVVMPKELAVAAEASTMEWCPAGDVSPEIKEIEEENKRKLADMAEDEILAEQKDILTSSDPLMMMMASYLQSRNQNKRKSEEQDGNQLPKKTVLPAAESKMEMGLDELPVKPKTEWVNMNTVELKKLEWMKNLPPPSTDDQKTGRPARFDFSGNIVPQSADIPVHLGLHHHGDEPERAGYTLQELFQLARSTNLQQRIIALTTISRVIKNARRGEFVGCLSAAVIPSLLDGGLVFLLRWALDENAQISISTSVGALQALVVCEEDELASDDIFCWHNGCLMPSFVVSEAETKDNHTKDNDDDNEEKAETDADVVKKDLVKGLLQMLLPERLRYLLEVCRPAAPVVVQIIEILTCLARHSSEAAYKVSKCPRLVDTIVKEFLPITWSSVSGQSLPSAYGYPLPSAIKFIRVLCSAGRNLAKLLVSKYNILRYLADDPCDMDLPSDVALSVNLESLRLLVVLLRYGLTLNIYCNFHHTIVEKLGKASRLNLPLEKSASDCICLLLTVVEATVHCAAEVKRRSQSLQKATSHTVDSEFESRTELACPTFSWSLVSGLSSLLSSLCVKNLNHFTDFFFDKPYSLEFAAASTNVLASYYERITDSPEYNPIQIQSSLITVCSDCLIPCFKSQAFSLSLQLVRDHSVFNHELWNAAESSSNLKTLGALTGVGGVLCPLLQPRSTVAFLVSILRLLIAIGKLYHGVVEKTFSLILNHEETVQYVRKVCRTNIHSAATNYFSRFENEFQFSLIQMARMKGYKDSDTGEVVDMTLYHYLALNLLNRLHIGDEHLCHGLLSFVLFNTEFLRDLTVLEDVGIERMEATLSLRTSEPLTSATQEKINMAKSDLLKDLCEHLPSMRSTYLSSAPVSPSQLVHSRNLCLHACLDCDNLTTGPVGQLLVPVDWVFLPLLQVHSRSLDPAFQADEHLQVGLITKVKDSLRAVYLLECARPGLLDSVSSTLKISRLICAFFAGTDLFLDKLIHGYLAELLRGYCTPTHLNRMDFTKPIPGIASFHDLYRQLVIQYASVSFGDSLFGCYLLLPLQQQHSVSLRLILWDDNMTAVRSIFIPVKELLIPVERFLQPEETNVHLIQVYFQALFSRTILPNRCPVPYLIAVHHTNRFLYSVDATHTRLKRRMVKELLECNNEELRHHLLYYKKANVECNNALELYSELPAVRQKTLEMLKEHRL